MNGPLPIGFCSYALRSVKAALGIGAVPVNDSTYGNWLNGWVSVTWRVCGSTTFRPFSLSTFGLPLSGLRSAYPSMVPR